MNSAGATGLGFGVSVRGTVAAHVGSLDGDAFGNSAPDIQTSPVGGSKVMDGISAAPTDVEVIITVV